MAVCVPSVVSNSITSLVLMMAFIVAPLDRGIMVDA